MEIFLGNDNYFVEGYKNGAIYDLKNEKVYELNETAKEAIIKYFQNEELNNKQEEFIARLIKKKIIIPNEISDELKFQKPNYCINFAWLELTDDCNLRCVHCYGSFGCPKVSKKEKLHIDDWKNVIDQLYDYGCRDIQLIGGEPLCSIDYKEIIIYLRKKGYKKITIFTNATLINETNINIIKDNNVNIRFSLYGYNEQTHESITKIKGSFKKTVDAIQLLKENGVKVSVAVVIMAENEQYLDKIRNFVVNDLKIDYNGFDVIRPSCINDNLTHRVKNYDLLSKRYYTLPKFKIRREQFINNHFYNPCLNKKIAITCYGDVIPCIFSRDAIAGNIKTSSLKNIQDKIENKWEINKNKIEECQNCEYKYACSDCRPLAIGVNGKELSKYPRCCYSPKEGIWRDIKEVTKEINI